MLLFTRYNNNDINHKIYSFLGQAGSSWMKLIREDQRVNFKYCQTCDICYKKNYFNSHKKNKFHTRKQNDIDDLHNKQLEEENLVKTIDKELKKLLQNNDIQISTIICDYLQDYCNDCHQITINPDTYLFNDPLSTRVNACQHCKNKYRVCCGNNCKFIGNEKDFDKCVGCSQRGCIDHIKKINGKQQCIDCAHGKVDTHFEKTSYQDNIIEIGKLRKQIKSQRKTLSAHAKSLVEKSKETKKLKIDLIRKHCLVNNQKGVINEMVEDSRKTKEIYEKELIEQKAFFFDKMCASVNKVNKN